MLLPFPTLEALPRASDWASGAPEDGLWAAGDHPSFLTSPPPSPLELQTVDRNGGRVQVEELVRSKLDPPKRLREVAARHWGELEAGTR